MTSRERLSDSIHALGEEERQAPGSPDAGAAEACLPDDGFAAPHDLPPPRLVPARADGPGNGDDDDEEDDDKGGGGDGNIDPDEDEGYDDEDDDDDDEPLRCGPLPR